MCLQKNSEIVIISMDHNLSRRCTKENDERVTLSWCQPQDIRCQWWWHQERRDNARVTCDSRRLIIPGQAHLTVRWPPWQGPELTQTICFSNCQSRLLSSDRDMSSWVNVTITNNLIDTFLWKLVYILCISAKKLKLWTCLLLFSWGMPDYGL